MATSIEVRAAAWANWRASMTTLRDRLQDLIIGDAAELFRTRDPGVLGPMVETMTAGIGFVNTDHVLRYVMKFLGVKITPNKKTGEILVEKDLTSDVWADTGAALQFIKKIPYWEYKKPKLITDWKDPYENMTREYGMGLLLGEITRVELEAKIGEKAARDALRKALKDKRLITDAINKASALGLEIAKLSA